jgi:glycosyltransferase involved in cell wall biosynthesis
MLRNYYLCLELSKHFDLTLLVLQNGDEFINGFQNFEWNKGIKIISPPPTKKSIVNAIKGRYYQKNWKRSAGDFTLRLYPQLRQLLKRKNFDIILFEHLGYESLLPLVKKYLPGALKIVDMHNVDHLLFEKFSDLSLPDNKKQFECLKQKEKNLSKVADFFFACSEKDTQILEKINGNTISGVTVPNGVDIHRCIFFENKSLEIPSILFCGSLDYEPNIDGLRWFVKEMWPNLIQKIPQVQLTIIGRKPSLEFTEELRKIKRVNFIGEVTNVEPFYHANNICIVPLRKGSGTRLKILEAMSFGNSIISTSVGAEGIDVKPGENILLADDVQSFVNAIQLLISSPNLNQEIRKNARLLVEKKYSWNKIGELAAKDIQEKLMLSCN